MVKTKQQYQMLSEDWPQIPGGITALPNLLDGCGMFHGMGNAAKCFSIMSA